MKEENKIQEINNMLMNFGPINGNIEKQEIYTNLVSTPSQSQPSVAETEYVSPVYLIKEPHGNKINLIRIINVLYSLGFFIGENGRQITKRDVCKAFGKAVNVDLSSYDKDLSRTFTDSTTPEAHLSIFNHMKEKMEEIVKKHEEQYKCST